MLTALIVAIVFVTLFMLYTIVALSDLSRRITAVGVALMMISGILQQQEETNEQKAKV